VERRVQDALLAVKDEHDVQIGNGDAGSVAEQRSLKVRLDCLRQRHNPTASCQEGQKDTGLRGEARYPVSQ
jgi:hypothetical protein